MNVTAGTATSTATEAGRDIHITLTIDGVVKEHTYSEARPVESARSLASAARFVTNFKWATKTVWGIVSDDSDRVVLTLVTEDELADDDVEDPAVEEPATVELSLAIAARVADWASDRDMSLADAVDWLLTTALDH